VTRSSTMRSSERSWGESDQWVSSTGGPAGIYGVHPQAKLAPSKTLKVDGGEPARRHSGDFLVPPDALTATGKNQGPVSFPGSQVLAPLTTHTEEPNRCRP
jgi:hypothetical protein